MKMVPMDISYIYWFAHYNLAGPCVRYRGKYFLEQLKAGHKIESSFVFPGYQFLNILHFMDVYFSALLFRRRNSIIVFQKIHTNGIYANALKFLLFFQRKNTIYDIDDAYYMKFPPATVHHFLRNSLAVITGSLELRNYAKKFNNTVYIASSPVIHHNQSKGKRNPVLVIGWVGFYNAHRENLMTVFFPALLQSDIKIKLILLGVTKAVHIQELMEYLKGKENISLEIPENIDWLDEESVYKLISGFDIGIAPLLDNGYNRAKSAFKLKQYLSCGIPVLGSNVGENKMVIQNGMNGFFCDTPEDYLRMIHFFNQLPEEEYSNYAANAKKSAALFSMEEYCDHFAKFNKSSNC